MRWLWVILVLLLAYFIVPMLTLSANSLQIMALPLAQFIVFVAPVPITVIAWLIVLSAEGDEAYEQAD